VKIMADLATTIAGAWQQASLRHPQMLLASRRA
jgi:hypothetical protein